MKPGYRSSQGCCENPLPGNHGHPITQHSTLLVAGGHALLDDQPESVGGEKVYDPERRPFSPPAGGPGNLSVAPTVAALFGIGEPAGGYDGSRLTEAFDPGALEGRPPPSPGAGGDAPSAGPQPDGDPREPLLTVGVDVSKASFNRATYALFVANRGNAAAKSVVLTNQVPQNTLLSGSNRPPLAPDAGAAACEPRATAGTSCRWALGDLAPGSSATVEVTYALKQNEAVYPAPGQGGFASEYEFVSTASAASANGGGTPSDSDRSLVRASSLLHQDAHVDDARPDTNFGACNQLELRSDNALTAFLDHDAILGVSDKFEPTDGWGIELWGGELRATAVSAPAFGAPIGVHRVLSREWDEGSGSCAGANGNGYEARAPSAAEPGTEPLSETSPTATAPVSGPGPVRWDVSTALDTRDERLRFNGFELRGGGGPGTFDTFAFHSSDATAPLDRPRLVTIFTRNEPAGCIDSDRETATGASHRAQRIEAYVTDAQSERISNAGGDGCNGSPVAGVPVGWELDDDTPDAYISSLAGTRPPREKGSSGDAGPNEGSTRAAADGRTFIEVALDKPLAEAAADTENRIAAIVLDQNHSGRTEDPAPRPRAGQGICDPGETWGTTSGTQTCTGNGESADEDDVHRSWTRVVDLAIDKTDQPDPVLRTRALTYTLDVANVGAAPAMDVTVTDTLPSRMKVQSLATTQGSCQLAGSRVTCQLGALAASGSATVTIRVRPYQRGVNTNSATVAGAEVEYDTSNNSDTETTTVH
jgi:uncharacterized repeat protein (TIGR01451 family)